DRDSRDRQPGAHPALRLAAERRTERRPSLPGIADPELRSACSYAAPASPGAARRPRVTKPPHPRVPPAPRDVSRGALYVVAPPRRAARGARTRAARARLLRGGAPARRVPRRR